MTETVVAPAARPRQHARRALSAKLLLAAAAVVFLLPWPHDVLSGVGTSDSKTLSSAAYTRSVTVLSHAAPRPAKRDDILGALPGLQRTASDNKVAADRRLLCLVFGLPGAYLLGRGRSRPRDE